MLPSKMYSEEVTQKTHRTILKLVFSKNLPFLKTVARNTVTRKILKSRG